MELRTVRILLVPDKEQRQAFYDSAYYSDKIYNEALQWNKDYYESDGMFYSRFDLIRMLPAFKGENTEYKAVDAHVLSSAVTDLRIALNNFKFGRGFPRFKRIGRKLSFGIRNDRLKVFTNRVQISSIGVVKCKHCHWLTRGKSDEELLDMKYHNPHIKFDGKYWFLIFGVKVSITPDRVTSKVIGVDLGIKNTVYTSKNTSRININYTKYVMILERRKRVYQKKLSHKYEMNKQGNKFTKTNNIKRLEKEIRLIYRSLHNIRESYNHSITNEIVRMYPKRIMIEDLNIRGMMKNRYLARAIQEQQFYRIRQLLIEKARNTLAIEVGVVSRFYPSSKMCSRCKSIKSNLRLSDRIFKCDNCGLEIDRDYNASINIRDCKDYKVVTC